VRRAQALEANKRSAVTAEIVVEQAAIEHDVLDTESAPQVGLHCHHQFIERTPVWLV
jgi:hypothetical protein